MVYGYNHYPLKQVFYKINYRIWVFMSAYFLVISEQVFILPGIAADAV